MRRTEAPFVSRSRPFAGLVAFSATELRVQLHEGIAIVTSVIVQVVLLIFVGILAPGLLGVALLGAIVFSMFSLGQRVQNEAAYVRIDHRLNQLYLASPLTPEAYFLGMAIGVLVAYLPPILLIVVAAEIVIHFSLLSAGLVLGVGAAVFLFSASTGYFVSTLFRDQRAIWSYTSLMYNLFGVLPPVFYPFHLAPPTIQSISLVLPPSAAAATLQWSIHATDLPGSSLAIALVSLVVEALAMFLFTIYWSRRTVREV